MALSVAIGGGLRLKDLSALYKNQQPSGTGSSGTMICVALKVFLLDDIWRAEMLGAAFVAVLQGHESYRQV